jgi:large subunit ribosomal protein L1
VGAEDIITKITANNWLDFDVCITTPDMMGLVGRVAKVLGPKGLMPNPKSGTVTMDVKKAVSDAKGGKVEYRLDKFNNVHCIIGKVSFGADKLVENYNVLINAIIKAKPSASKGTYLKSVTVTSTMGVGVPVVQTMA